MNQFDIGMYEESLAVYKRQQEIRVLLDEQKYLGFVANGSILPRLPISLKLFLLDVKHFLLTRTGLPQTL